MNPVKPYTLVMIPAEEWQAQKDLLQQIREELRHQREQYKEPGITADYILATEFMKAVGIKKSKLYELIAENKIKTVKKSRHLYVLATEVKRYFTDPDIR
ncbi:helix-turn-helix domain-containing protein [Niabella drilacis]|uniref:Helix-turn-helix domain-containing protein n=1 Tax=Niabella drilacis (strain DSM 25811 / CCM 8410 / CCUG 62505 / LMG 26954 / E90) TaxID=1285928 RepID=A0A1G6XGA2_NIADE|nr:helix-turn-helix domain-containing protein [Niabella drilacis]SDD77238.1 hypothetical protein SAMN04487894_11367 [Niabella drilacis]